MDLKTLKTKNSKPKLIRQLKFSSKRDWFSNLYQQGVETKHGSNSLILSQTLFLCRLIRSFKVLHNRTQDLETFQCYGLY